MYMRIKCENILFCGNYQCGWNCDGRCGHDVVALDATGKCTLEKPKVTVKNEDRPAQNKF